MFVIAGVVGLTSIKDLNSLEQTWHDGCRLELVCSVLRRHSLTLDVCTLCPLTDATDEISQSYGIWWWVEPV